MPIGADPAGLCWKPGVPTIGANGIAANVPGEVDQYLDWAAPSYAKLCKHTNDAHYLDVARILLHDTKAVLALPGRTYDLKGPGFSPDQTVSSLSWMCSFRTIPKTIAASRPLPTGRACVHAPAGCRYQSLRASPSRARPKPEPHSSAPTAIWKEDLSRISVDAFAERNTRPVVCAKRDGRKAGRVVQRCSRERLPGVTDSHRVRN